VDTSACKRKSRGSGGRARSGFDRQNNEDSMWSGRTTVSSNGGRRVMQKRSCTISQRPAAIVKTETEAPATTTYGFMGSLGFNTSSSSSRSNSASDSTHDASTNSPRSGASDATSCESGDSDVEGIDELFFALDQDECGDATSLHSHTTNAATVDIMDFLDSMGTIEPCMLLRDDVC
jgi:hypothetical protein